MKSWARPNSVLLLLALVLLLRELPAHWVKGEIAPGTEAMMVVPVSKKRPRHQIPWLPLQPEILPLWLQAPFQVCALYSAFPGA